MSRLLVALLCILPISPFLPAAHAQDAAAPEPAWAKASPEDMAWWKDARFGLFIHWGPVSLKGTEIGWSRGGERRGTGGTGEIPVEIYDTLYKDFNPVDFNAREWVQLAKDAGMKYLVFTSKHHDGFSMFDSALTDYKITNSPFGRDVVGELADACHDMGLRLGYYYSPPDWHHPDYRTDNHQKYIEYMHGQLREICTNYGQIDIIWFDGLGGTSEDWDSPPLFQMIRELQPHVIINNRAGLPADFGTPEQRVGGFDRENAWESCITIGDQWAYKPNDRIKSLEECLRTLISCAGGDGNLLFNVGPTPEGIIESEQADRLREMGDWLDSYGETIYGTRGGPFKPGPWGASTCKDNRIYVHVYEWDEDGLLLPPIASEIISAALYDGGEVSMQKTETGLLIRVPEPQRNEIATVITLTVNDAAFDIPPVSVAGSLTSGKAATASNVYQSMDAYTADKAFDDSPATRWATDAGTHEAWIEVDLGEPKTFSRIAIDEALERRVREFELQALDGGEWKTFYTGKTIGSDWKKELQKPVTAQRVRLSITQATEGPTINEFHLYAPKRK